MYFVLNLVKSVNTVLIFFFTLLLSEFYLFFLVDNFFFSIKSFWADLQPTKSQIIIILNFIRFVRNGIKTKLYYGYLGINNAVIMYLPS